MPWRRGRSILARLASCVAPGGRLIVQVVTAHRGGALPRALARVRYALPIVHRLWNIARQRPASDPPMQLNVYPLATVLADMTAQGLVLATEQELWPDVVSTYLVGSRPRPV